MIPAELEKNILQAKKKGMFYGSIFNMQTSLYTLPIFITEK